MLSLWEVLKTSKGLPAPDGFTALFAHSLSDTYTLAEISGIPPLNLGEIVEIVDYTIYGNIYQSDGVSSDTPQEVVGCGDFDETAGKYKLDVVSRGKNLFDGEYEAGNIRPSTGELQESSQRYRATNFIPVMPNTTYTFSKSSGTGFFWVIGYKDDFTGVEDGDSSYPASLLGTGERNEKTVATFTTTPTTRYVKWYTTYQSGVPTQLELGTEATSYEPYHEPITTPIYLDSPLYKIGDYADSRGMTEEVRVIKELVLTGEENWVYITGGKHWIPVTMYQKSGLMCICSHYEAVANGSGSSLVANGQVGFYSSTADRLIFCNTNYTTTEDWKSYLAAQYSAGTPVKVYYVLATPEIKAVEPVEIPTIQGTNIIDINTEVKPSNLKIIHKSKV